MIPIPDIEDPDPEDPLLETPETIQVAPLPVASAPAPDPGLEPEPQISESVPETESNPDPQPEELSPDPDPTPKPPAPLPDSPPASEPEDTPPADPSDPAPSPELQSEPPPEPPTLQERLADPKSYLYNQTGTTEADGFGEIASWFEVLVKYGDPEKIYQSVEEPIELDYLLGECLVSPPVAASVGVIVDANEDIIDTSSENVGNPRLLRSTGYNILNVQAIESVKEYDFPDESEIQAYVLKVEAVGYDADACHPSTD